MIDKTACEKEDVFSIKTCEESELCERKKKSVGTLKYSLNDGCCC